MAVNFSVATLFTAKDRISGAFKRMGNNADKFGRKSEKAFNRASRSGKRFNDVAKGIIKAQVLTRGFQALTAGISEAAVEFANFDQSIISASAKFKGLDLTTKKGIETFERLKNKAREVGATTEFSASQAAQGLDFLALAGFNSEQAMAALGGTVNLATSANIDLGLATDIATDSLGAFGLMTKDSIQLQKNLTRVNDVMAKTMATSNTSIEQLFEAVAAGAADFTQAGQSMETFSALAGIMANSGKKGESAGTALRNVMVRLAAPTGEAAKILERFAVKTQDQAGNFRDVVDILGDFDKATRKLGSAQKTAAISTVFGLRAQGAINILLKAGSKEMSKYRDELQKAGGASQRMADIMRSSLINRLKGLRSALLELTFKVFAKFEERGKLSIDKLTEIVRAFDPTPIIVGIEKMVLVFEMLHDALKPLVPIFKFLNDAMDGPVGKFLERVTNPFAGLSQALQAGVEAKQSKAQAQAPQAPNKREAEAKAQNVNIQGLFSFENPPAGMTFQQGQGPLLQTSGLGGQ
jgi:TP901 family phage tail tape measure protein